MAEFKITRFRYTWRGEWRGDSGTYFKDDVVLYQGKSWVCLRQHTASIFADDQNFFNPGDTFPSPAWSQMTDGYKFIGSWMPDEYYDTGVLVVSGGNVYLCISSHRSTNNFIDNLLDWELFASGSKFRKNWEPNRKYNFGDVIKYNGYTYRCILEHDSEDVSSGIIVGNADSTDDSVGETWNVLVENYHYVGNYQSNQRYRLNDIVKYGGSLLKCIEEHTSSAVAGEIDNLKFENYLSGFQVYPTWSNAVYYAVGDIVNNNGISYIAIENNFNNAPGRSISFPDGNYRWEILANSTKFVGVLNFGNSYKQGQLVLRGGSLWKALVDQLAGDDSTLEILDDTNWELVIPSFNYRGSWNLNQDYNLYDVVYYRGNTWFANFVHSSAENNFPGDNGEGIEFWTLLIQGDPRAGLTNVGDLLTYNLSREEVGDTSTFNNVRVPIGDTDQLLYVENNQGDLSYKTWGSTQRIFYVRTNGVDDNTDPNRGINYFKPFKTVRYALEQADDGFEGHTTVFVSSGEYQEVLPLIVPKRTAVVGEELRSTTIRANEPIAALANDVDYTLLGLTRLTLILDDIVLSQPITPTIGNDLEQDFGAVPSVGEANRVLSLVAASIDVIEFKVKGQGVMPSVTGSNTASTNSDTLAAISALEDNREFIKEEVIAYVRLEEPEYDFDTTLCKRDLDRFIDAWKYDLLYGGNYKSVLAGRYYSNGVIGSALEDMFYVRDATGIRNCTLKGLNGALPAAQPGEDYQIPTGGNFVSLDPGWGPDDERVWITTRSCYVQNVTTFGAGAVGQKIDGLLHNGGNKSIVSNDFTQVISDGIGAWVQNGGRAELVSVFTYYAHIGMFAKDGGIIRATNGNSSYGDFGAVADGIDPDEVVRYAKVNTRTEQAQVAAAFAGEVNDYILALEFSNAGQEYTTATYTITSSGLGAVALQEEFRDNALFEAQVYIDGDGYIIAGNQAQGGGGTSITLATSETVEEADILGMRLILVSGEGTGQYGYITAYNPSTKVCNVARESDNQAGWDNILPGTPNAPILTTGTRYRIEPRVTFSDPGFTAAEITLDIANSYSAAIYGETSQTFTNVSGTPGTGNTVEVIPSAAIFTVIKTGRSYTVTMTSGGAGYAPGDTIIIDGGNLGGLSIEHDITISVLTTTDDSTNSIIAFEVEGTPIADSGKFILGPSTGHFGRYSSDGQSWSPFDFPADGNWKCLASGNNRFVAIAYGSANAASSTNGINWTQRNIANRNWNGVAHGNGVFLAVAGNLNAGSYSLDGETWTSITLPTAGDSTLNEWVDVAYGQGKFIVLANSNNIVAEGTYDQDADTWSWTWHVMDVVADSSSKDWVSIAYGNRRWVAISSTGDIAYSFDGAFWLPATMPSQDGSTAHNWKQVKYGQGVFFAVGDTGSRTVGDDVTTGPTNYAATSYDGVVWTERTLANSLEWGAVAFGNPDITLGDSTVSNNRPTWIVAPSNNSVYINRIYTGARALGRAMVEGGGIGSIRIWEPGSGYLSDPVITLTDPNNTVEATFIMRLADGVLAQPTFIQKGQAYKTSTTIITVSGDGFADIIPIGRFLTLDNLEIMPGPGAQFYIGGSTGYFTAVVVDIETDTDGNGKLISTFQVSPRLSIDDYLEHDMEVVIRERYSQVRITGHDFLDVGVGGFEDTNYPELYRDYNFTRDPLKEVQIFNGGRVFYTSTDQDGNFRAGDLFAVEQATGIITISADFFDLEGLTELRLGGVQVGSTAIIREFSKDPLFLQNSNNVIPTQRAIIAYLQSRLNIGGEDLLTPSIIAGTVKVGPNLIDSTAGLGIIFPRVTDFSGPDAGLSGSWLSHVMFYRGFRREL
jgi:hypothetical protein